MSELNISDKFLDFLKNRINEHIDIINNYYYNEEKLNNALEKLQVETAIYANLVAIYTNAKTQEATDEIINSVKNIDANTINNAINQFRSFTGNINN